MKLIDADKLIQFITDNMIDDTESEPKKGKWVDYHKSSLGPAFKRVTCSECGAFMHYRIGWWGPTSRCDVCKSLNEFTEEDNETD